MPNAEIHPDAPLTAFAVPLESLESASGALALNTSIQEPL